MRRHGASRACYKGDRPSTGPCDECRSYDREYQGRWRAANRTKELAKGRKYRVTHRAEINARRQARRDADREAARAKDREWYAANKEKASARYRRWRTAHLEQNAERMRRYRAERERTDREREVQNNLNRQRRDRELSVETDGHARVRVFERDGGVCQLCGVTLDPTNWHEDHIIPLSAGGPDTLANVQATCPPCNLSKGAKTA